MSRNSKNSLIVLILNNVNQDSTVKNKQDNLNQSKINYYAKCEIRKKQLHYCKILDICNINCCFFLIYFFFENWINCYICNNKKKKMI